MKRLKHFCIGLLALAAIVAVVVCVVFSCAALLFALLGMRHGAC